MTLVNNEQFSGTINYSYAVGGSDSFTPGLPTDAGTYTVKASIAAQGNYTAATTEIPLTLTIRPTPVTLTFADQTITYGDTPAGATANPASAKIEYSYTTGEGGDPIPGWPTNAGTYTVTAKVAATGNYGGVTATAQLVISKAPAITPKTGDLAVANKQAHTYTYGLGALRPDVSEGMSLGSTAVTYELGPVNLGSYYDSGAMIDDQTLTLPIKAVESDSETKIGTITVTIHTQNFEDMTATIDVRSVNKQSVDISGVTLTGRAYNGDRKSVV